MMANIKKAIPIIFLLYGLFYFFEPVLLGWFEILSPSISRAVLLPIRLSTYYYFIRPIAIQTGTFSIADILFPIIFLSYIIYYIRFPRTEISGIQKKIAISPMVVFPILFIISIPLGITSDKRQTNSLMLGGKALLMTKGGSATIRDEALQLMNSSEKEILVGAELPPLLRELGEKAIIESDNKVILIGEHRMINFPYGFGFMFQAETDSEPYSQYGMEHAFSRYLKLADGVYLYVIP